jgi:hypothetical protein
MAEKMIHCTTPSAVNISTWLDEKFPEGDVVVEHTERCGHASFGDECIGGCDVVDSEEPAAPIIPEEEMEFIESINTALKKANEMGSYHAQQVGGTYGYLADALIGAIACAMLDSGAVESFATGREVGGRIYDEITNNGENFAYNLDLFNRGVI